MSLALTLAVVGVGLILPTGSGAGVAAVAGQAAGGSSASATGPQVRVLHVYFRNNAERDLLSQELGAEEAATTAGYLTILAM